MKNANVSAIILGTKNIGESDKFVFLYTSEFGKIRVVAKGARKMTSKFTGHLETLNVCTVALYFGKSQTIIQELITKDVGAKAHANFDQAGSALQIAEITNRMLFESQSIDDLFKLIEETTLELQTSDKSLVIILSYIIKFLDMAGLMPNHKTSDTELNAYYQNFFEYAKTKSISEISKINLRQEEKSYLKNYLEEILQNETQMQWQLMAS